MSADVPRSIRVLHVNDDESALYVTTKVLRRAGFDVLEAETGLGAMRQARQHHPDIVVLDVRLPDVSGIEVCKALKSDPETSDIVVVQTSAVYVTSADRTAGLTAGADAYLTQPFEAEELVATIHSLLRGRRLETEAVHRAEALTQADQRKDEFLAMLAHELRNPLSAILTASRLLQMKDAPPTPKLASTIERQAHHLASLIDDLLDVSRITHGKIQLKRETVDACDAITRAVEASRPTLDRRGQNLDVAECERVFVNADPVRLEQILGNLISNASKYSSEGGHVTLSLVRRVREGASYARICVTDDGIGLASHDRGRIFDLFYQVDTSIARSQGGLGIGLTMVRRLVEMQGGTIDVESAGRGEGSTFVVELPEVEEVHPSAVPAAANPGLEGARVLLVDDNTDACELMQLSLEQAGCVVATAFDGGEALRLVGERPFDAAVLDIGLPVLDGYQLATAIVENLGGLRPKLVALTGYGRAEDRGRALRAGFDVHLVKPTDGGTLIRTLTTLVRSERVRLG